MAETLKQIIKSLCPRLLVVPFLYPSDGRGQSDDKMVCSGKGGCRTIVNTSCEFGSEPRREIFGARLAA